MPPKSRAFKARNIPCPHCPQLFLSYRGRTQHIEAIHGDLEPSNDPSIAPSSDAPGPEPSSSPPPANFDLPDHNSDPPSRSSSPPTVESNVKIEKHPILDGTPCDADGYDLPLGAPAPSWDHREPDDFASFDNRAAFEFADFLYIRDQMSGNNIDQLMQLMAALYPDRPPPFADARELYARIDDLPQGDIPWESFAVQYTGPRPATNVPTWMTDKYEVWFRSPLAVFEKQLANPDFKDELDWAPKRIFKNDKRQYTDLFSGNWAWQQAGRNSPERGESWGNLAPGTQSSILYMAELGIYMAIPKTTRQHAGSVDFRKFRRQLFHASLARIFSILKPYMTTARVTRCADRHFRRAIYGFGPVIADYPEQALYACIVQGWCPICLSPPDDLDKQSAHRCKEHTEALLDASLTVKELWDEFGVVADIIPFTDDFPRADIHELISVDLLHQLIKGTFKDHLVDWIVEYIQQMYDKSDGERILADIDRRIAITPPFTGLRNFPKGRNFKQWTGDDSKGLMKVFLPAIAGRVPSQMVQAVAHFTEFCYLVRRSVLDEDTLSAAESSLAKFWDTREVFRDVRPEGFSLPRQHSTKHYVPRIRMFGAPNGLCSSITESKHIKAVKKPYRRSNHNQPLSQMLLTNQRLDKLHYARVDFASRGMLSGALIPLLPPLDLAANNPVREALPDLDDDEVVEGPRFDGEVKLAKRYIRRVPRDLAGLASYLGQPRFPELVQHFLFGQLYPDYDGEVDASDLPSIDGKIYTYNSAQSIFYAPSDICGIGGMRRERIRSARSWFKGPPRYDCAFVVHDRDAPGMLGFHIGRVLLFSNSNTMTHCIHVL
ncbi:hypothetical protein MIND_00579900 [Mycena indigotica]|uniref:C2H2-type domain-containing protein n=1 Tax=Mycena indigotica TaxID=2126181 RepID=A0A8H6SPL4_9AGAR|nr:uncharacterized protein MIND_00579900 [Mycena indigotica]KAF7303508.1 hypothetical protein MIND_00579900 [Mycena indigotica]